MNGLVQGSYLLSIIGKDTETFINHSNERLFSALVYDESFSKIGRVVFKIWLSKSSAYTVHMEATILNS